MTVGAATEGYLGELHEKVAKRLTHHVDDYTSDPRYVQMATKFLSDNKITAVPNKTNAIGDLQRSLNARKKRVFEGTNITDLSTKLAMDIAEGE